MTIRLLSTHKQYAPQMIVTLDPAIEARLVADKNASLDLTGGTAYFEQIEPPALVAVKTLTGPVSLAANQKTTIPLPEGQALSITGTAGTIGLASLLGSSKTWPIGTGALAQIGPYAGTQRVLITCSAGSVEATVGSAVLGAAAVALDVSGNPTGLLSGGTLYAGVKTPAGVLGGNLAAASLGAKITNIATGTVVINAAAAKINSPMVGGSAMKLSPGASYDLTNINFPTLSSQGIVVGFWAFKPKSSPRSNVNIYISKTAGFTNYVTIGVVIEPGLNFYALPHLNGVASGTGINPGDTIVQVRFRDLAAGGYPALAGSDYIQIGDVYYGHKPQAVFVWGLDDCKANVYAAPSAGGEIAGYDGVPLLHSAQSFLATYGWRGTAYAIGGAIGATIAGETFASVATLRSLQNDFGWTVGSHSFSHPNDSDVPGAAIYGLRLLGPAGYNSAALSANKTFLCVETGNYVTARNDFTAIRDDLENGMAVLESIGIKGYQHFATPQSAVDDYVDTAIRAVGIRTVRGPNNYIAGIPSVFASAAGAISGGAMGGGQVQTAIGNISSSLSLDGGATDAQIAAYIDNLIFFGAVGATQSHGWTNTIRGRFKACADYLKIKEQAGLIKVLTAEEFYNQQNQSLRMF